MSAPAPSPSTAGRVSARVGGITPAVDAKARELKARGRPVIGFGAGQPAEGGLPEQAVHSAFATLLDPGDEVLLFESPSGAVYPRERVEAIGRWAHENGLRVVTDEMVPDVETPVPLGAFYVYPPMKFLPGKEIRGVRAADEAFGTPGDLRISYAVDENDLAEGITTMRPLFAEAR
ncbi:hypothetical protein ACFORH_23000 [Amycolatopsis roodepoortensis]|uniref:Uncharacterized protein n=1 Tax=Amycolatopsis roodepoortensis TaxID=700274 RepID=A0ABR9LML8_9PSEU|nr:hypothetical protein [Amycolatopsis roodepoortensis]MBE1581488.1 hypothetical protein [Amycolatopsis roodepoortensis]